MEVDSCSFTVPVIAGSISAVIVVAAAIIVVTAIIVCLKYHKLKKNSCHQDKKLKLEEKREDNVDADRRECRKQEETKEKHREMRRQWSREQVEKLLEEVREMRESAKHDVELSRDYIKLIREVCTLLSSVATDSEEERNEEIEKAQREQFLKLLQDMLKGGKRNESLKLEMLRTIMDEVGNDVNDYVGQKLQSTCL